MPSAKSHNCFRRRHPPQPHRGTGHTELCALWHWRLASLIGIPIVTVTPLIRTSSLSSNPRLFRESTLGSKCASNCQLAISNFCSPGSSRNAFIQRGVSCPLREGLAALLQPITWVNIVETSSADTAYAYHDAAAPKTLERQRAKPYPPSLSHMLCMCASATARRLLKLSDALERAAHRS